MSEEKEYALPNALDRAVLPTNLTVSSNCMLNGQLVLEAGLHITALHRGIVKLLIGKNWNGEAFRMNTNEQASLRVDCVEEMYPTSVGQLKTMLSRVAYVLAKVDFETATRAFKQLDKFLFDSNEAFKEDANVSLVSFYDERITLPLSVLLDPTRFVFIYHKDTTTLQQILMKFTPQTIRFLDHSTCLPVGNVHLQKTAIYETVLIVHALKNDPSKIRYEQFQLDARIKVNESNLPLPNFIARMGDSKERLYGKLIKEMMPSMSFDIYTRRFYGSMITDHPDMLKQKRSLQVSHGDKRLSQGNKRMQFAKTKGMRMWKSCDSIDELEIESNFKTSVWERISLRKMKLNRKKTTAKKSPTIEEQKFTPKEDDCYSPSTDNVFEEGATAKVEQECDQQTGDVRNNHLNMVELQTVIYNDTGITDIDPEELIISQQMLLDQAKMRLQSAPERILQKPSKIPPIQEHRPKSADFENVIYKIKENELYGVDENSMLSRSYDEMKMPPKNPPRTPAVLERRRRAHTSPGINLDSGIDSPDTKQSVESITAIFETAFYEQRQPQHRSKSNESNASSDNSFEYQPMKTSRPRPTYLPLSISTQQHNNSSDNSPQEYYKTPPNQQEYYQVPRKHHMSFDGDPRYESIDGVSMEGKRNRSFTSKWQRREIESLEEISNCSIKQIFQILEQLQLSMFEEKFMEEYINGVKLTIMQEKKLIEMGLTAFEARKLYKYVRGWRKKTDDCENVDDTPCEMWSVRDVESAMRTIELEKVGDFASAHQVDGTLLDDLVQNNYMVTLERDYGVTLTLAEDENLKIFLKGSYNK